jgi:hypothetical protein
MTEETREGLGSHKWLNPATFLVVSFMVFNSTFNDISVILWQSVLLVEETGGP